MRQSQRWILSLALICHAALYAKSFASDPMSVKTINVNVVAVLWPAPTTVAEADLLIAVDQLLSNGQAIWPRMHFSQVLEAAESAGVQASTGSTVQIQFVNTAAFKEPRNWIVVGRCVGPVASGGHANFTARFGLTSQMRLVVQTVNVSGLNLGTHDVAEHPPRL